MGQDWLVTFPSPVGGVLPQHLVVVFVRDIDGVGLSGVVLYYASTYSWNIYLLAFPSMWIERLEQLGGMLWPFQSTHAFLAIYRLCWLYRFRVLWSYLGLLQDGRVYGFALGMGL
jgi:hypothetical protein